MLLTISIYPPIQCLHRVWSPTPALTVSKRTLCLNCYLLLWHCSFFHLLYCLLHFSLHVCSNQTENHAEICVRKCNDHVVRLVFGAISDTLPNSSDTGKQFRKTYVNVLSFGQFHSNSASLPSVFVRIVQRKRNHVFRTNANPIDGHSVDFWSIAHTGSDAMNCSDSHRQILCQIPDRKLVCCIAHDCCRVKKNTYLLSHDCDTK